MGGVDHANPAVSDLSVQYSVRTLPLLPRLAQRANFRRGNVCLMMNRLNRITGTGLFVFCPLAFHIPRASSRRDSFCFWVCPNLVFA
jgi:hypothetical protein